jgi:dTDP-glucose 4,6-dehydratase
LADKGGRAGESTVTLWLGPDAPGTLIGVRLLATGGAGFIGSNDVGRILAKSDASITVDDALTYASNRETLSHAEAPAGDLLRLVHAKISDFRAMDEVMPTHCAVANFAHESHVDRSVDGPYDVVLTNCVRTNLVVLSARPAGAEGRCISRPTRSTDL